MLCERSSDYCTLGETLAIARKLAHPDTPWYESVDTAEPRTPARIRTPPPGGLETFDSGSTSDIDERLAFPAIERAWRNIKFHDETLDSFAGEHSPTHVVPENCGVPKCHVHLRGSWPDSHKRGSVLGVQVSS